MLESFLDSDYPKVLLVDQGGDHQPEPFEYNARTRKFAEIDRQEPAHLFDLGHPGDNKNCCEKPINTTSRIV